VLALRQSKGSLPQVEAAKVRFPDEREFQILIQAAINSLKKEQP